MQFDRSIFVLIGIIILVAIYKYFALEQLTVPILGLLMATYLVISMKGRHRKNPESSQSIFYAHAPIYLLLMVVYIIIIANGGVSSPLFFLLSFISFALAFFFPPSSVFIVLLGSLVIFLPDLFGEQMVENSLQLGSLLLFTPIAYYFGKEVKARVEKQKQDAESADRIRREAATVLRDNQNLPEENKIQLADIIQETDSLRK